MNEDRKPGNIPEILGKKQEHDKIKTWQSEEQISNILSYVNVMLNFYHVKKNISIKKRK